MKKERNFSKAEIKKLWLQFILLATAFTSFILYGFYGIHKQEQMFKERGVVTAATIFRSGGKYVEFQYEVNEQVYNKTKKNRMYMNLFPGKSTKWFMTRKILRYANCAEMKINNIF